MLVLTRKTGESIKIGDHVTVKILSVRAGQVKIGIEAPKETPVYREEIYERILAEQKDERAGQELGDEPSVRHGWSNS